MKVKDSPEFRRVATLPRRNESDLAEKLTAILKTPQGTMRLRPVQARALYEMAKLGGLFAPIAVGGGKTLISLLASTVIGAERPLLILPASLIEKTKRECKELQKHFQIKEPKMISYELLGRTQSADFLSNLAPDLIVCDEAHRLKNRRAAVTRRVARQWGASPFRFVAMSGTILKASLHDFAHLVWWALGEGSPITRAYTEIEVWNDAIGCVQSFQNMFQSRPHPGPLLTLGDGTEEGSLETRARQCLEKHMFATPGVVRAYESGIDCSLQISPISYSNPCKEETKVLFDLWETPSGLPLSDPMAVWRHARELALGFYYRWDPEPPKAWMQARKDWGSFVRRVLAHSKQYDSELQVAQAHPKAPELVAWKAIKDTFRPNTVPVWRSDKVIQLVKDWGQTPGIIWCEHVHFASRLAEVSGFPNYAAGVEGLEQEDGKRTVIASIAAHGTGRNLQKFERNLITCVPKSAVTWEQLIGRTHRPGQEADEVIVDYLTAGKIHDETVIAALEGARLIQETTGNPQKLLLGLSSIPMPFHSRFGETVFAFA